MVTIEDLSNQEIEDVLDLAQEYREDLRGHSEMLSGYIMASLFFEPSTRTRGSFESAMKRLGGQTITTADVRSSSIEKGESLADTIRVWSGYCDMMVMRHPWEGAARLAAEYASVPVVNGGDGGHEHPTQTLCDLFTLRAEHGTLDGLRVALCGDLKNGRTVHSLTFALLRFGAQIIFVPGEGLELPEHIKRRINMDYGMPVERVRPGDLELGALFDEDGQGDPGSTLLNAIYMTPSRPHQLAMHQGDARVVFGGSNWPIAFYMTRYQKEREGGGARAYPKLSAKAMKQKALAKSIVLHPLPRVDEISTELDKDPRSRYFEQARNGVPVRMALISLLLGKRQWRQDRAVTTKDGTAEKFVAPVEGLRCGNSGCVTWKEPKSCAMELVALPGPPPWFICKYCERDVGAAHFAYKGKKLYHPLEELQIQSREQLSRLRMFQDEAGAREAGLKSAVGKRARGASAIEVTR